MTDIHLSLGKQTGSHHGDPQLFERDVKLLRDYQLWIKTANEASAKLFAKNGYQNTYGKEWVPSEADIAKSRLFWRIRSGKPPLPEAPPTAYSCSWYELIEVPGPHSTFEEIRVYRDDHWLGSKGPMASVAQSLYSVLEEHDDGSVILQYNCYKFKAWNAPIPTRSLVTDPSTGERNVIDTEMPGGWIEYMGVIS